MVYYFQRGVYPRGVMVKAIECRIIVNEFVLQSCNYVHFRANTLGKAMKPPYYLTHSWEDKGVS